MDNYYDTSDVPSEAAEIESAEPVPVEPVEVDGQTDFELETQLQVQDAVSSIQQVEGLDPESWQQLDSDARTEILQDIEGRMAEIQGREAVPVVAADMGPATYGGFDGTSIRLNADHLASDMPVEEFIDTIVHEGRHAYQYHAVDTPGFVADNAVVSAWAENRDNYLTAEEYGQEIYTSQPLEADAWEYAGQITNALNAAE